MGFDEEDVFNVELRYLAEDVRILHNAAMEARKKFRKSMSPDNALDLKVALDALLHGLIATGRYKDKKNKYLEEEREGLSKINYQNKKHYPKLFSLHTDIEILIAEKNLFQKKPRKVDKV